VTVLVGVKCIDGVVIGADSMATSAMGPHPLVQLLSDDKIQQIGDRVILATTGSVGLGQRLKAIIEKHWESKGFTGPCLQCMATISGNTVRAFHESGVPRNQQNGLGFGALLAAVVEDKPYLCEFGTLDFQPEIKQGRLFSVSMGSGQLLADPFLAFVSRVLWNNTLPNVDLAKIGVYWVLNHTIQYAPGGVGHPIKLGVVKKQSGKWTASVAEDTQEQDQFIAELESRIKCSPKDSIESAPASALPQPPRSDGD